MRPLGEIDYDTYAAGEAVLGWLNMTVQLRGAAGFEARQLATRLISLLRDAAAGRGEIAHVKLVLTEGDVFVRANVERSDEEPSVSGPSGVRLQAARLLLNARVQMAPELLRAIAVESVQQATDAEGANATITFLQSFSPGYPARSIASRTRCPEARDAPPISAYDCPHRRALRPPSLEHLSS